MMKVKALSPVMGVIVMVIITVILAALLTAFIINDGWPIVKQEDKIAGVVIDRYSYDGVNHYIDIISIDCKTGSEIKQTLWTDDAVLFHHIYSGGRYIFTTRPPGITKYPHLIGVV